MLRTGYKIDHRKYSNDLPEDILSGKFNFEHYHNWKTMRAKRLTTTQEQLIQFRHAQGNPGWPAMIALSAVGC